MPAVTPNRNRVSQNPVAERYASEKHNLLVFVSLAHGRPRPKFIYYKCYASPKRNKLLNISKILVSFELNEHLIHEIDYILHVVFMNSFNSGVHVFQWQ